MNNSSIWHRRFFHINFDNIVKVSSTFAISDLPKIIKRTNLVFKEYILAKKKKVYFPNKKFTTTKKLVIIHTDLRGPSRTRGFYGERYFMIFVDDFTSMIWVTFLKDKYESFEMFKIFNNRVEN